MQQSDIREILGDIANNSPIMTRHHQRMETIIKHLHKAGHTVETISGHKYLGRSASTIKRYARDMDLIFPDYTPAHLKEKR